MARNELGGEKGRQQLSLRSKSGKAQIARTLGAIHHLRHTPARTQAPQHRMGVPLLHTLGQHSRRCPVPGGAAGCAVAAPRLVLRRRRRVRHSAGCFGGATWPRRPRVRDVPRRGGTKSKPTVCTVNCRPWCSKLWDLRISRTDSLYQWRGLNQTKRGGGGALCGRKKQIFVCRTVCTNQTEILLFPAA